VITMGKALLTGLFVFAFVGLSLGCSPPVPANPTYTKDVKPILDAHCVRCHGAGGTLNSMVVAGRDHPPMTCYLQRYEDTGDCSTTATCQRGAGYCGAGTGGSMLTLYTELPEDNRLHMPPLPSESLNDWEMEVLKRWATPTPAQ
jgi:hypothetical protein